MQAADRGGRRAIETGDAPGADRPLLAGAGRGRRPLLQRPGTARPGDRRAGRGRDRRAGAPLPAEPRGDLRGGGDPARGRGPDDDLPDRDGELSGGERGLCRVLLRAVPGPEHRRGRRAAEGGAGRDRRHRSPRRRAGLSEEVSLDVDPRRPAGGRRGGAADPADRVPLPLPDHRRDDRAQGREPAADRLVQAPRRAQQDRLARSRHQGASSPEAPGTTASRSPTPPARTGSRRRCSCPSAPRSGRSPRPGSPAPRWCSRGRVGHRLRRVGDRPRRGRGPRLRPPLRRPGRDRRPGHPRPGAGRGGARPRQGPGPLGGGGLAAGVATAVKESLDGVEVIGVQAEMRDATTLADGIAVKRPGEVTGPLLERLVDEIVSVGESEIAEAIVMLLERTKLVVEGAGAVGRRGAPQRRDRARRQRNHRGDPLGRQHRHRDARRRRPPPRDRNRPAAAPVHDDLTTSPGRSPRCSPASARAAPT